MKTVILIFSAVAAASAQTSSDPITAGDKSVYNLVKAPILRAAEKMPEASYSFKPTPEVRSFGQLIGHIADGHYEFCAPVLGDKSDHASIEKTATTKAALVDALKASFAYCDGAWSGMTDAQGAQIVDFFGRKSPKLTLLGFNTAHDDEHYGNIVTYMRLKGLVPPSSEKQK